MPEHDVDEADISELADLLTAELTDRESKVLSERLGIGHERRTKSAIADDCRFSAHRLNAVERKALNKLRHGNGVPLIKALFLPRKALRARSGEQDGVIADLRLAFIRLETQLMLASRHKETINQEGCGKAQIAPSPLPIKVLELSARAENGLLSEGVATVEQLILYNRSELLLIKGLGLVSVREIERALSRFGLRLSEQPSCAGK